MRPVALAGILASTTILTGCAGTIAGVSLSSITQFAGFASTLFTGADLGEHAVSLVTGKDCRFSEGLVRSDRKICEEPGSAATRGDFHGIFVERIDEDGTVIYAAPKYMSASVGAGENENNVDAIWAEIKTQKAKEENERQLARADAAAQTLDVASLATGSLSAQSLAYMPSGTVSATELSDGDTASQTAAQARPVVNAAKPAAKKDVKPAPAQPSNLGEPAIDETALVAPLKAAAENGQGGPLITTSGTSAPVVSKLVNGEPVVILHLAPMFGTPPMDTASAEPAEVASIDPADVMARPTAPAPVSAARPSPSRPALPVKPTAAPAPSPLAILDQARKVPGAELKVAEVDAPASPTVPAAKPRTKPSAAELSAARTAAAEKAAADKAAKELLAAAPAARPQRSHDAAEDVYQPPGETGYEASTAPDLMAASPVESPADIPTAAAPVSTNDSPSATTSPAPLFPIAQP